MTAYTIIMINQIAWGIGIFTFGVLVGYMLKIVLINMSNFKRRKEGKDMIT